MEKIVFYDEELQEEIELEVVDQITLEEVQYLLVVDDEDEATILKLIKDDEENLTYSLIEDEHEFQKVALSFMESDEYDIEV